MLCNLVSSDGFEGRKEKKECNPIITYSHCMGMQSGQAQGTGLRAMGSSILYRNVHTGLRQAKELGSIVSYCARPVHLPVPIPFLCSVDKPLVCG